MGTPSYSETPSISISKAIINRTLWMADDLAEPFIRALAKFSSDERHRLTSPLIAKLEDKRLRSGVNVEVSYAESDEYQFLNFLEDFSRENGCHIRWSV